MTTTEAQQQKEEGNKLFQAGDYANAIVCYTKALKLESPENKTDQAVYYKNRAACQLKLENWERANDDATKALEISPTDTKALFRRAQALEQLGKTELAFKDARNVVHFDPKNKAVLPILKRLSEKIQHMAKERDSTNAKVTQMFNAFFDQNADAEKRSNAANNLVVLGRDCPAQLFQGGGVQKLLPVLESKEEEYVLAALRAIGGMAGCGEEQAVAILSLVGAPRLQYQLTKNNEEVCLATGHLIMTLVCSLTGLSRKEAKKPEMAKINANIKAIGAIMKTMTQLVADPKLSGYGRDAVIDLLLKLVPQTDGIDWIRRFLDDKGIWELLKVGSCLLELTDLPITKDTRGHVALCLNNIYNDLESDKERARFREQCDDFIMTLLKDLQDINAKVKCVVCLTTLLQGPFDVGNSILGTKGFLEIMLVMAGSEDTLQQKVAVEAIIQAASKPDKSTAVVNQGSAILKKLYQSQDDHIRVRALAALCKAGSSGGTDAASRPLAEGSTVKLATACLNFLKNPRKDTDLRKWATEGLLYLSLDADVKELIIGDIEALRAIVELSKHTDEMGVFSISSVLVNLTNSYDKTEVEPEMVELANFAKKHVPEEHEFDAKEYADKRVQILVKNNVISALVGVSKSNSYSTKENIARVFFAVTEAKEHRGIIVQQGGAKVLLPIATEGTPKAKSLAAHALARIAITNNPQIAFPGQRCCEIVRPLIGLLHPDQTGLANFEALMALTNLATVSNSVRQRIITEDGLSKIEHWCYEEHEMIRRSAVQCILNMLQCEQTVEMFLRLETDRVKLLVLYCGDPDDDIELSLAAAGCLAILSHDERGTTKIADVKSFYDIIKELIVHDHTELQYRGMYVLANILERNKEMCQKIVEGELLETLMAMSKIQDFMRDKARKEADRALKAAEKWELIKKNPDAD